MAILYMDHRGGFIESMETVRIFEDFDELFRHLISQLSAIRIVVSKKDFDVSYYTMDQRNNWDTYIVTVKDYGVIGFCNQGLPLLSQSPDTYECCLCHGTFTKGWTDDEAMAELETKYPGMPLEECGIVCDDCFVRQPKHELISVDTELPKFYEPVMVQHAKGYSLGRWTLLGWRDFDTNEALDDVTAWAKPAES